jgi:transposase
VIRRLKAGWQRGDGLLCLDWTLLRLFPPLRATWALKGAQAVVPITGRNAKRVLFGAIDLKTARRVVLTRNHAGQADAQAFLRALRRRYRGAGWLWLLTDRASAHTAPQTQALADRLRIRFVWLPRQTPELSPMDHLWRDLKRLMAANRQAVSIDMLAADAAAWVMTLTPQQARRKAGMESKDFWLRKLSQYFWRPT